MAKKTVFSALPCILGVGNDVLIPLNFFSVVRSFSCWDEDVDGETSGVGWFEKTIWFGKAGGVRLDLRVLAEGKEGRGLST